jgi:predicted esterase
VVRFALLVVIAAILPAHAETLSVKRPDGSDIKIEVARPASSERGPIVLAIDGSLCTPEDLSEWLSWLRAQRNGETPYSVVVVAKPGPATPEPDKDGNYNISPEFRCTDEFKKYYTLDQRVLDHLQAIAYLRKSAPWWDGRLLVWGFSDGAHIGARVGTYTAETKAAVLLGMGGGTPMAAELEKMMCADAKPMDTCLRDFRAQTDAIRKNPVPSQSWLGDANTYAAWSSRLDGIETNVLRLASFPVRLVHGERDGSVPVAAARALAEAIGAPRGPIEYTEVPGMGHGLGSNLAPEQADKLRSQTLGWLLERGLR